MAFTRTQPCKHPDLGLLAPRPVRDQCLLFKPSRLQYSLIATGTYSDAEWPVDKNRFQKNKRIRMTPIRVVPNSGPVIPTFTYACHLSFQQPHWGHGYYSYFIQKGMQAPRLICLRVSVWYDHWD